jgi:dCMP deaminase
MPPRPLWDDIWMEFAERLAQRSTCSRASVGCVVVSTDNSTVLGLGYNGGPKGLNNDCLSEEPGKCGHLHAEINALIKTNYRDAAPKKVYLTTSPCYNCAVALINANIQEVIFKTEYRDQTGVALLSRAGITVRKFSSSGISSRDLYINKDG